MINSCFTLNRKYWYAFDFVKGILIITVFMGHIIPGGVKDTFLRYAIYSFHMPLFIGISGFLLNMEKLNISLINLSKKYWNRMILPWIIAVICFYSVNNILTGTKLMFWPFINAFLYPFYHLWYIQGFISYMVVACVLWYIFQNTKYKWYFIFGIALIISIFSRWNLLEKLISANGVQIICYYEKNNFRLYNFIFFVWGIYCRYRYEHSYTLFKENIITFIRVILLASIIMVIILFWLSNINISNIMFYVMNVALITLVVNDSVLSYYPRNKVLEFLGRYSMPIYLYHVLCKILAQFCSSDGTVKYYFISFLAFIIQCVLVYYLKNIKIVNRIIFGSTSSIYDN